MVIKIRNVFTSDDYGDDEDCVEIILDRDNANKLLTVLDKCYEHYPTLGIRDGSTGNMLDILHERLKDQLD